MNNVKPKPRFLNAKCSNSSQSLNLSYAFKGPAREPFLLNFIFSSPHPDQITKTPKKQKKNSQIGYFGNLPWRGGKFINSIGIVNRTTQDGVILTSIQM